MQKSENNPAMDGSFCKTAYLQCWRCHLGLCQILHRFVPHLQMLLCKMVPNVCVDEEEASQWLAGFGAGNPAAQRACNAADGAVRCAYRVQAAGAEGVKAMEHPWDPVAAIVLIVTHRALKLFVYTHGDSVWGRRPGTCSAQVDKKETPVKTHLHKSSTQKKHGINGKEAPCCCRTSREQHVLSGWSWMSSLSGVGLLRFRCFLTCPGACF